LAFIDLKLNLGLIINNL